MGGTAVGLSENDDDDDDVIENIILAYIFYFDSATGIDLLLRVHELGGASRSRDHSDDDVIDDLPTLEEELRVTQSVDAAGESSPRSQPGALGAGLLAPPSAQSVTRGVTDDW